MVQDPVTDTNRDTSHHPSSLELSACSILSAEPAGDVESSSSTPCSCSCPSPWPGSCCSSNNSKPSVAAAKSAAIVPVLNRLLLAVGSALEEAVGDVGVGTNPSLFSVASMSIARSAASTPPRCGEDVASGLMVSDGAAPPVPAPARLGRRARRVRRPTLSPARSLFMRSSRADVSSRSPGVAASRALSRVAFISSCACFRLVSASFSSSIARLSC